jgi:ParB family transcriptional regulator, chromosome partitioning protein
MSADRPNPRRLGRGLEALISGAATPVNETPTSDLQRISISRIRANPFQPRREFNPAELAELEASLRASGLLQPITLRRRGDAFELIAGERRLRAASNLGWTEITAIIRDFDDRAMLVLALVENLQRSNLNAIEEARGYRRLLDEFGLTQQQVAEAVGKDRTTVTNLLRVLALPDEVQQMVQQGTLTSGHARALLALGPAHSAIDVAKRAAAEGLTVRDLERLVRELAAPNSSVAGASARPSASRAPATATDPAMRQLEDNLRRYLQTDVRVLAGPDRKGKIEVSFYSNDDLDRVLDLILREQRDLY